MEGLDYKEKGSPWGVHGGGREPDSNRGMKRQRCKKVGEAAEEMETEYGSRRNRKGGGTLAPAAHS